LSLAAATEGHAAITAASPISAERSLFTAANNRSLLFLLRGTQSVPLWVGAQCG